jgi:uncharacterized caspase-like protein
VKFLRPLVALLLASLCLTLPAQAERRIALVIGNGEYAYAPKLKNPRVDAEAMHGMLQVLDFQVIKGINVGRDALTELINRFAQDAVGADVALFYYAGHAFQLEGRNLLVPIDASIKNEFEAKQRTVEIDSVLQYTMDSAKVKLVLLDGCRDNPFTEQMVSKTRSVVLAPGLAEMKSARGTLIAFATSPGKTALDGEEGKNSPFTRALLTHLPTPGLEIGLALKRVRAQVVDETRDRQLPWDHNSMTGEFFMRPVAAAPQGTAAGEANGASGFDERALELAFWTSAEKSGSVDDYRAYLARYPAGTYATLARNRVAALSQPGGGAAAAVPPSGIAPATGDIKTAEATKATQDALGLTTEDWKQVQVRLVKHGTRSIDGTSGDATRSGLKSWQAGRGYPVTGYLNRLQYEELLRETPSPTPLATTSSASRSTQSQQQQQPRQRNSDTDNRGPGDRAAENAGKQMIEYMLRKKFGF